MREVPCDRPGHGDLSCGQAAQRVAGETQERRIRHRLDREPPVAASRYEGRQADDVSG